MVPDGVCPPDTFAVSWTVPGTVIEPLAVVVIVGLAGLTTTGSVVHPLLLVPFRPPVFWSPPYEATQWYVPVLVSAVVSETVATPVAFSFTVFVNTMVPLHPAPL